MRLNVIIVNWNARNDTIRCVRQVEGWSGISSRVWVVDNGSQGGDLEAIMEACPRVTALPSEENRGFSGGTNLGLFHAVSQSKGDILLLNNDVTIDAEAVLALLETLEREEECGVVGPVICHGDDARRVLTAGNRSPVLHRNHALSAPLDPRDPYPVVFVSGAVTLIRALVLKDVGFLDESYFFGLELADFCRRASRRGHLVLVNPGARVSHHVDRSSALRETLYLYYVVRNRFLYARTHHPLTFPALWAFWALHGIQQSWRLGRRGRRPTARALRLGVGDGLRGVWGGQNERILELCSAAGSPPGGRS